MPDERDGVDPTVPPSGTGCQECLASGGWWFHLRRCAQCGHVGCCDTSPSQHTTAHAKATGHPVVRSFEPDEDWWYDYRDGSGGSGLELAPPLCRPLEQPTPGPAGQVPADWKHHLNT